MEEETLVLIKPDGTEKNIIGEVLARFEKVGLKIIGLKLIKATEKAADEHYKITEEWAASLAKKTRDSFAKKGIQLQETDHQIASRVQKWLKQLLMSGLVVAMVVSGNCAIEIVRKIAGNTEPKQALPGTIRGDFSTDSYDLADKEQRAIKNIIHASSSTDEAQREISIWFPKVAYY